MNKTAKKVVATILTTVMTVGAATVVSADDLSITLSHQPYSHALPSYIGEEEGIFEENGLNTEILWFSSGNTQNEALGANEWDAGACGTPPAIAAGIAYNAKIVGFSVDDTVSVDYWVRADSDIAAISGEVEGYPDILGNADTWKGKTILCPTQTSAHYMLIATLSAMGLTQNDVSIVHMDVPSAYTAFKAGQGDIVALWDPQSYQAEEEGWVKASSGEASGETMPTVLVASEQAIEENWDAVYAWVKNYYEISEKYKDDIDTQSEYLLQMQLDNGIDTDEELARRFVEDRPLPTLEENVEYFKGEAGNTKADEVVNKIVQFFIDQGTYTDDDMTTLKENGFVDGEFIRAIAEEKRYFYGVISVNVYCRYENRNCFYAGITYKHRKGDWDINI
ncbi:MAG: ABC transporter substrate-binding protein [Blautia faecis]